MEPLTLRKVTARRMDEISPPFKPGDAAEVLYRPELSPVGYLSALIEAELYPEAIRLLATILPRREAVAWAAACVRECLDVNQLAKAKSALATVDAWLADPSDAHAMTAQLASEAADPRTPAGCLANGVYYCGTNINQDGMPRVLPPAPLPPALIAGSVILAAITHSPTEALKQFAVCVNLGISYASQVDKIKESRDLITI